MDKLELVLEYLTRADTTKLVDALANDVDLLRNELEYRDKRAAKCDCESLQSRIAQLEAHLYAAQQDKAYLKSVADQRQATIDSAMLKHSKEQCALGIITKRNGSDVDFLDYLYSNEPQYGKAWGAAPWALKDEIEAIDKAKKIERIKVIRQWLPGLGLKQAKDFIDNHTDYK